MSYLHCPTCSHAFNLAVTSRCPVCPVPAAVVDPVEDILVAQEALQRAMERATPAQRERAGMAPLVASGSGPIKVPAQPLPVSMWMRAAERAVDLIGRAADLERRVGRRIERRLKPLLQLVGATPRR
ncbi:MAG: hypothetical protein QM831_30415 [Kofleriaceae bacterium]